MDRRRGGAAQDSGACGPQAVKARQAPAGRFPALPRFACAERAIPLTPPSALDGQPPLIAAWLVGLQTQPAPQEAPMKPDLYQTVTDKILADLERGVRPWQRPWSAGHAAGRITQPLRANGTPYRGINIIMLWSAATAAGFTAPIWMTFKQALEFGGHVRRGEKGSLVVYADRITRTETDAETGEESEHAIPFLKSYTVFNVGQIDDLPERFRLAPAPRLDPVQRIDHADAFFAATGADIRTGGNMAAYNLAEDRIAMPAFVLFQDAESYYATLAHEMTHWTCHPTRLNRDLGRQRWGDAGYAREELVAELGAAFLSAALDLASEPREDHAAYLASWIKVLKEDKRAIFTAAAHAQRAADYLRGLQPEPSAVR